MTLTRAQEKEKTIAKILSTSLDLYNRHGVHSVSMHLIAEKARISPGHLTYHFHKKKDINDALVDKLEAELLVALSTTRDIPAIMEAHAELLIRVVGIMWRYRFFFNNVVFLTGKDASQKKRYLRLKKLVIGVLMEGYERMVANGSIIPVADEYGGAELLVENYWYLTLSHLRLFVIEAPKSAHTKKAYSKFAALHAFSWLAPLYSDSVRKGYQKFLDKKFA